MSIIRDLFYSHRFAERSSQVAAACMPQQEKRSAQQPPKINRVAQLQP